MKISLALALLQLTVGAPDSTERMRHVPVVEEKPAGFGFKGLRIGMTRQELFDLVATTPWGFTRSRGSCMDVPLDSMADMYLLRADSAGQLNGFLSLGGTAADTGRCQDIGLGVVSIERKSGRVSLIMITSRDYSEKTAECAGEWYKKSVAGLTAEYGIPTSTKAPSGETDAATGSKRDNFPWMSAWKRPVADGAMNEMIEVRRYLPPKEGGSRRHYVSIMLSTVPARGR